MLGSPSASELINEKEDEDEEAEAEEQKAPQKTRKLENLTKRPCSHVSLYNKYAYACNQSLINYALDLVVVFYV